MPESLVISIFTSKLTQATCHIYFLGMCHWWWEKSESQVSCFISFLLITLLDLGVISQAKRLFSMTWTEKKVSPHFFSLSASLPGNILFSYEKEDSRWRALLFSMTCSCPWLVLFQFLHSSDGGSQNILQLLSSALLYTLGGMGVDDLHSFGLFLLLAFGCF